MAVEQHLRLILAPQEYTQSKWPLTIWMPIGELFLIYPTEQKLFVKPLPLQLSLLQLCKPQMPVVPKLNFSKITLLFHLRKSRQETLLKPKFTVLLLMLQMTLIKSKFLLPHRQEVPAKLTKLPPDQLK